MPKKTWADLSPTQKKLVVVAGVIEAAATTWCVRDLAGRPSSQVRGPKLLWGPALSVQPFGPIAYVLWGRRR
ncbi:PLDc N-terminal domain-containing protein [Nocardioides currus]|uniref:Cardiolipin synthase N-terminal domain-containing protein n=1 Tax=Nocardioides currus TaxID=2133958 RepID=A0A2R7YV33_9ACTN|nr:PLDc N-terminal domain-containing protein [Nocardioides currus]PUA80242.1 hypothetical protein C7S10_13935 [Nocardioides currus]